jgi:hypothetical protein
MLSPGEMAYLIEVPPKWIHNAALRLRRPIRHSVKEAIRLALARKIHDALGVPLSRAMHLASEAIQADLDAPFVVASDDGMISLSIDVTRLLIAFNAKLAWMRNQDPLPKRGRPPATRPHDALAAAEAYGVDLSLVRANLRRSPAERLTALDENAAFIRNARKGLQRPARRRA